MPVVMEIINFDFNPLVNPYITGYGQAVVPANAGPNEIPALIAFRLRWDRPWRKDRTLDYSEATLQYPGSLSVELQVHYAFGYNEEKKVYFEMINKRTGKTIESKRIVFSGISTI